MHTVKHHKNYEYTAKDKSNAKNVDLMSLVYDRGALVNNIGGKIRFQGVPENTEKPKSCLLLAEHKNDQWSLSRCFKKSGKMHGQDSWIKQPVETPTDLNEKELLKIMNIWARMANKMSKKSAKVKSISPHFRLITARTDTMNKTRTYNFDLD